MLLFLAVEIAEREMPPQSLWRDRGLESVEAGDHDRGPFIGRLDSRKRVLVRDRPKGLRQPLGRPTTAGGPPERETPRLQCWRDVR